MKMRPGPKQELTPVPGIDKSGRTPLWYHAANGDIAGVRAELAGGADPSFGDNLNYSPLHVAVQNGRIEVIGLLLEAGADPNKTDTHGNTPLWTAVLSAPMQVKVEIVTQLLRSGANPDHKNRADKSPRDAANTIAGGIEVPFAGVEKRCPELPLSPNRSWMNEPRFPCRMTPTRSHVGSGRISCRVQVSLPGFKASSFGVSRSSAGRP